ncbi:MAG: hypothetical protein KTR32_35820 [Granulosicoccus sp.]|nr:hypothetical protein [Granulosicoccus sp.]
MEKFPDDVIVAMHSANVTLSCVPVQIDHEPWQAAVFYVLAADAPCLSGGKLHSGPYAVELDADLHEHANGSLIEIGLDIATPVEHSRGTLLFLTGHSKAHFEALSLLVTQNDLPLFLGDQYCNVLYRQRIPLTDAMRAGIKQILDEAVNRDAVIRMTGQYEPDAVFSDVVASLQLT